MNNLQKLITDIENGVTPEYLFFWGHKNPKNEVNKTCLSQWYPCRFRDGIPMYKTAEHYMMAMKALLFDDAETHTKIMESVHPNEAKSLGRQVKNFDENIWKENLYDIVYKGNFLKFTHDMELQKFLISTDGKILVEASPYDKIYGIGMLEQDPRAKNPALWNGQNVLGFILMDVRDNIIKQLNKWE